MSKDRKLEAQIYRLRVRNQELNKKVRELEKTNAEAMKEIAELEERIEDGPLWPGDGADDD